MVCISICRSWKDVLMCTEVLTHILSHLPPSSLSAVSLVSHRFHSLVTTPHAWRIAFARFFPGPESLASWENSSSASDDGSDIVRSERRVFTRVTALASWRSEYILRTRLLRSLARGKPAEYHGLGVSGSSRSGASHGGNAQVTYNSNLVTTVTHLEATFGTGLNKRFPRFIHGADEVGSACSSDPKNGKVDNWGFSDPQSFLQFADRFPGDSEYGLGAGEVVGVPNTMDVSQSYGMVYAEGFPGGLVYYRSVEEQRGRFLALSMALSLPELGIPKLEFAAETVCSVWIAKTPSIPTISEGVIGLLSGSSCGVVTAYSLGTTSLFERRIERGEITARWTLSPGVPIIAIAVDEMFSLKRHALHRIWAVVLNALGEVFYLTKLPTRPVINRSIKLNENDLEKLAWETGREVHWTLIEQTRRIARPDPFDRSGIDGSYSPRSSWNGMGLSKEQITAESREIENFIAQKPKHFRKVCDGWDMRRKLEVDFAGGDDHGARECILIVSCGLEAGQATDIRRFTRCTSQQSHEHLRSVDEAGVLLDGTEDANKASISGDTTAIVEEPTWSFNNASTKRRISAVQANIPLTLGEVEEWRVSQLSLDGLKSTQITTIALDMSTFAILTKYEDPLLSMSGSSATSSPTSSPLGQMPRPSSPSDVPGQCARFFAVGTKSGALIVWNIRASISGSIDVDNIINPIRMIHTDSPQIACLALSSLYLVHGGNDGLVQAWDLLASSIQPIRTLNSRFSSRARRRLVQAEASPQGVGINLFAAGAICLDPDPTVLRGMVSLGTHLRYWSYSSSAADQYKTSKRRLRRSERGSNHGGDRFSNTGRGALKEYIANERLELEKDKENRRKEEERLAGRFGLDLLGPGASEDEILAYATLLSEEAAANDEQRRRSGSGSSDDDASTETITKEAHDPTPPFSKHEDEVDPDIAEAIRLSLQEVAEPALDLGGARDVAVKYVKSRRVPSKSPPRGAFEGPEADDLQFALRLSLAEESRGEGGGSSKRNGKGKGRAS